MPDRSATREGDGGSRRRPRRIGIEPLALSEAAVALILGLDADFARGVATAVEDELAAVTRPVGIFVLDAVGEHLGGVGAVGLHHVDLVATAAVRAEGDSAGGPGGFVLVRSGGESDVAWVGAVGVDDEDVGAAVGIARVGDLRAVRRPGGLSFPALGRSESAPFPAAWADDVEIEAARRVVARSVVGDLGSVGRPARVQRHRIVRRDVALRLRREVVDEDVQLVALHPAVCELSSVGRPVGIPVEAFVVRDRPDVRPVHVHDVDVPPPVALARDGEL